MRPAQVLDIQMSLYDHMADHRYSEFVQHFVEDMVTKGKLVFAKVDQKADDAAMAKRVTGWMRNSLKCSYAYHVQADMMAMIRAASMDLEGTDYIEKDQLPSEHGFVVFDEPWMTTDVWGYKMAVHAMQWGQGGANVNDVAPENRPPISLNLPNGEVAGLWLRFFTDVTDPRDEYSAKHIKEYGEEALLFIGRYHLAHMWFMPYGMRVGPMDQPTPEHYRDFVGSDGRQPQPTTVNDARLVVAYFRLLGQTIVTVKDAPIERAARRRAERAKMPARVQTITLRKRVTKYAEEGEHQSVDWSHRWLVRGHWAWRACGPDHPLAEPDGADGFHARLYIAPYVKGPEGKPLVITEKVFDLAR